MTDTLSRLPAGDHGDCTGCDLVIRLAKERGEKPPHRGRSEWALTVNGKRYYVCLQCAARSSHVHGIAMPSFNPTGAKSIALTIPAIPKEPTHVQA